MNNKILFNLRLYALFCLAYLVLSCPSGHAAKTTMSPLLEVNASNKSRCVQFFFVNEKLHCSTTPIVGAPTNMDAVKHERMGVVFDNRKWGVGWGGRNPQINTVEYIPPGDKIDTWHELITSQFMPIAQSDLALSTYPERIQNGLQQRGYNPQFVIHEKTPQDVIFEFKVSQPIAEAQDELQRVIARPEGLYCLHYAIRQADMTEANRQKWLKLLKQAQIKN